MGEGNLYVPERPLTVREVEILIGIAEGKPRKAIAAELGISRMTLANHVRVILVKLGASNAASAVAAAKDRHII
jgi:DNA-binding NarL/FixJ family response regulator